MFGEKLIVGYTEGKIDNKRRVFLPPFANASTGDELALLHSVEQEKIILYLSSEYLKLVIKYRELQNKTSNIEEYLTYEQKIIEICAKIDSLIKVDNTHRILIPKMVIDELNWDINKTIIFKGEGNRLTISQKK